MILRFAYVQLLYVIIPIFLLVILYRLFLYKAPIYYFPMVRAVAHDSRVVSKTLYHKKILWLLRFFGLLMLGLMIARPQWVDEKSQVDIKGIDIVMALDVSGSMQLFDDIRDRRTRIEVAKQEAIRFIEKRPNDPIGVVIFGKEVLSRCPLTLDKIFLKEIVGSLELGMIDSQGTSLGTGLAMAVSRLKKSEAKSKVVILLTDGQPTPPEKIEPDVAIQLAQEFGVKIYTIGIGNEDGGFFAHPHFGVQRAQDDLDLKLMQRIAEQTGGQFFRANNPQQMRQIYDTIDQLETTEYKTDLFHNYYEAFLSFIWIVLLLFGLEFFLRLFVWRGI